jgi:hypothetical protein
MKHCLLAGVVLAVLSTQVCADTTHVMGIWYRSESPFIFNNHIVVDSTASLRIEAGVTVIFTGHFGLTVNGLLLAQGREGDSIRFTTDTISNPTRWTGIKVASPDTANFQYCVIENAGGALHSYSSLVLDHSVLQYNHGLSASGALYSQVYVRATECVFRGNRASYGGGIYNYGNGFFEHCHFLNNSANYGGGIWTAGRGYFHDCEFAFNSSSASGGGIRVSDNTSTFEDCWIHHNHTSGSGGGIAVESGYPTFTKCVIEYNSSDSLGGGVWDHAWGVEESPAYLRCVIKENSSQNGGGIFFTWGGDRIVQRCTLINNSASQHGGGIYLFNCSNPIYATAIVGSRDGEGVAYPTSNNLPRIWFSDLYGNFDGDYFLATGQVNGRTSGINYNGDPCDYMGNIYLEPQFMDTLTGDYHLRSTSPLINAGGMSVYSGAPDSDGTPADIGAFPRPDSRHTPPSSFGLFEPSNYAFIFGPPNIRFDWEDARDPDYHDTVYYALHLESADTNIILTTVWSFYDADLSTIGLHGDTWVNWWVDAHSNHPDTTVVCNHGFTFWNGIAAADNQSRKLPKYFWLYDNYPNPFNSETRIAFDLPKAERVRLEIFDLLGRNVATLASGLMSAGNHETVFEGRNLASGVYVYRLQAGQFVAAKKLVMIK